LLAVVIVARMTDRIRNAQRVLLNGTAGRGVLEQEASFRRAQKAWQGGQARRGSDIAFSDARYYFSD
jgi:hypothetical protein